MKRLMTAIFCAAVLLLAAGSAHAYAVYNHVGHRVCVHTGGLGCDFTVGGHDSHSGKHGAGLKNVSVVYKKHGHCYGNSDSFDIPEGGYIRIYDHKVRVYKHSGEHTHTKGIDRIDCPKNIPDILL